MIGRSFDVRSFSVIELGQRTSHPLGYPCANPWGSCLAPSAAPRAERARHATCLHGYSDPFCPAAHSNERGKKLSWPPLRVPCAPSPAMIWVRSAKIKLRARNRTDCSTHSCLSVRERAVLTVAWCPRRSTAAGEATVLSRPAPCWPCAETRAQHPRE